MRIKVGSTGNRELDKALRSIARQIEKLLHEPIEIIAGDNVTVKKRKHVYTISSLAAAAAPPSLACGTGTLDFSDGCNSHFVVYM